MIFASVSFASGGVRAASGTSSDMFSLRPPVHTQRQPFLPVQNHLQPARSNSRLEISTRFISVAFASAGVRDASGTSSDAFNLRPPAHTQRQPFLPVQNHLQPARPNSTLENSTTFNSVAFASGGVRAASGSSSDAFNLRPPAHPQRQPF